MNYKVGDIICTTVGRVRVTEKSADVNQGRGVPGWAGENVRDDGTGYGSRSWGYDHQIRSVRSN